MTEQEAQRMLDEHRQPPRFVRGRTKYIVRRDGSVELWKLSKSGKRSTYEMTVEADWFGLHPDVRKALAT